MDTVDRHTSRRAFCGALAALSALPIVGRSAEKRVSLLSWGGTVQSTFEKEGWADRFPVSATSSEITMIRRLLLRSVLVSAMVTVMAGHALAQDYPKKLVRLLHPYSAGSGPDVAARAVAQHLSRQWGQTVIVEAKPGASGFIGLEAAKRDPADGHTLTLIGLAHMSMNPALYKKLPYDWQKDFTLAGLIFRTPFYVVTRSAGPYKSVGELIAAAKLAPEKVTYGTPYVGSPIHLGAALLESVTGTKMLHVPYSDQTQIFVSIASGELDFTLGTPASAAGLLANGRVKLLAVANDARVAEYPDVPTVAESGGPAGFGVESWVGLAAPSGTPADVMARINASLNRALADPEVRKRFSTLGYEPAGGTPKAFEELALKDLVRYTQVIRQTGLVPQ